MPTHTSPRSPKGHSTTGQLALAVGGATRGAALPCPPMGVAENAPTHSPYPVNQPLPARPSVSPFWSPETDTRGPHNAGWPTPDVVSPWMLSPYRNHDPHASSRQEVDNPLGLYLGPVITPKQNVGWGASLTRRTTLPQFLPPPPGLPPPRRAFAQPSLKQAPVEPYRAWDNDIGPWAVGPTKQPQFIQPQLGNAVISPFGPLPGLASPWRNVNDAFQRSFLPDPTPPPPVIQAQFDLRSDEDEIVVPNRNGQRAQAPGAIGGSRRFLAEPV